MAQMICKAIHFPSLSVASEHMEIGPGISTRFLSNHGDYCSFSY